MSLTASMWTSVSGLLVHGEKMNVIGNNISNVNTVGFKASRMDFQDFISQYIGTAAGMGQVGRGTSIGIVMNDFSQAAFETTTETTDVAIAGNGFFAVSPKGSDQNFYTRAGNFRFDKDGFLVDPHGYVVQGWQIDNNAQSIAASTSSSTTAPTIKGSGVPDDVRLDTFSCNPKHTTNMTMAVNLDSGAGNDKNVVTASPFASIFSTWDATPDVNGDIIPLGPASYSYPATIEVYDEGGQSHTLTIYFDRVENPAPPAAPVVSNLGDDTVMWEYTVTMDPSEDIRVFDTGGAVNAADKGLLMTGTLTFSSTGQLEDMTAFVPTEGGADFRNMNNWVRAPISNNGFPVFAPNFSGTPSASEAWNTAGTTVNPNADGRLIEFDLGLRSKSMAWDPTSVGTLAGLGTNADNTVGMGARAEQLNTTSTSYTDNTGNNFYQRFASQNGYTHGELRYVTVSQDGVLSAAYSNGVSLELFQLTLYDFPSKQNLRREGGNLFSETRESGLPISGAAGSGSFGTTESSSLEQSNVDLAREFVQMITTQRGFQANSKSVTTVDTMLDTVINMKR